MYHSDNPWNLEYKTMARSMTIGLKAWSENQLSPKSHGVSPHKHDPDQRYYLLEAYPLFRHQLGIRLLQHCSAATPPYIPASSAVRLHQQWPQRCRNVPRDKFRKTPGNRVMEPIIQYSSSTATSSKSWNPLETLEHLWTWIENLWKWRKQMETSITATTFQAPS